MVAFSFFLFENATMQFYVKNGVLIFHGNLALQAVEDFSVERLSDPKANLIVRIDRGLVSFMMHRRVGNLTQCANLHTRKQRNGKEIHKLESESD
jgi:hypothetical protein